MPPKSTVPPSGTLTVVVTVDEGERRQLHRRAFARVRVMPLVDVLVGVRRVLTGRAAVGRDACR